jgi:hypothetical protein
VAAALASGACADRNPTAPASRPPTVAASANDVLLQPVARAAALALASPQRRLALLADFRDSPFAHHALHLQSYLRGPAGAPLTAEIARRLRTTPNALLATLDGLPALELAMGRRLDRTRWTGGADLSVAATTASAAELLKSGGVTGYRVDGTAVRIPIGGGLDETAQISVIPAQAEFGSDPEARRASAPHRAGESISTPAEEAAATRPDAAGRRFDCTTTGLTLSSEFQPCTDTGGATVDYGGIFLSSTFGYDNCLVPGYSPGDRDQDQIIDECEYQLAYAFRPILHISEREMHAGRESYWAVARNLSSPRSFRIFYALGYHQDTGSPSVSGMFYYDGHSGDSEFIVLEIEEIAPARWAMRTGTLSAHWNEDYGLDGTGTWSYSNFQFPSGGYRARPYVWVAQEKHANYKTRNQCDAGAQYFDNCDGTPVDQEVEVRRDSNLGNHTIDLVGCVASRDFSYGRNECLWGPGRFYGWYAPVDNGATSYGESLRAYYF